MKNLEYWWEEGKFLGGYFSNTLSELNLEELKEIRRRLQAELKDKNVSYQRKREIKVGLWELKSWIKAKRYDEFKERQRKQKEEKS